jgi:hypothetical protein
MSSMSSKALLQFGVTTGSSTGGAITGGWGLDRTHRFVEPRSNDGTGDHEHRKEGRKPECGKEKP